MADATTTAMTVKGMTCKHCVQSVTDALSALPGVRQVDVRLEGGAVRVEHEAGVDPGALRAAVEEIGFDVVGQGPARE